MKTLLLALIFLSVSSVAKAEDIKGRATIEFIPVMAWGGVLETDLRQVGNQILGNSTISKGNFIALTVSNGIYTGRTGRSLTNLKCTDSGCTGFINGIGVSFSNQEKVDRKGIHYMETGGTVNNRVYHAHFYGYMLSISGPGFLDLKMERVGKFTGRAVIGLSLYDVVVTMNGSLENFLADPALVAIFLGASL